LIAEPPLLAQAMRVYSRPCYNSELDEGAPCATKAAVSLPQWQRIFVTLTVSLRSDQTQPMCLGYFAEVTATHAEKMLRRRYDLVSTVNHSNQSFHYRGAF